MRNKADPVSNEITHGKCYLHALTPSQLSLQALQVISLFHPINLDLPKKKNKQKAKKDLSLDNSIYVSFIGLIRKYKGLEVLIHSIKYLKNKNIKLIIYEVLLK